MSTRLPSRPLLWSALGVSAAWLLAPILTPAHVEGFSASIVALGLHIADGNVALYDQLFPANLEFFGLSRLGAALAVAALSGTFGLGGDVAMRVTMWVGFIGLVVGSWVLVRQWTRADPLVIAAALLLLPGLAENAFFYNDNVLSSALAVGALALVASTRGLGAAALAGLAFGVGMVTRADAVLLAPAVPLLLHEQTGFDRRFFQRGLTFGAGALVALVGVHGAFGATFLDVLAISRYVVSLWARGTDVMRHTYQIAYFVGLPGAALAALGIWYLAWRREYRALLLLVGVPLVFNLVSLGTLWQARQLLPITPFVAALAVHGWQLLAPMRTADGPRWPLRSRVAVGALAALTAVVLLAPTRWLVSVDDGPRALRGRVWSVARWRQWQDAVHADLAGIRHEVTALVGPRPAAVATEYWNADRYVHLALLESGYRVVPATHVPPACARVAELFERDGQRIAHLRLHVPFLPAEVALISPRMRTYGEPCLRTLGDPTPLLVASRGSVESIAGRAWVAVTSGAARTGGPQSGTIDYEPHVALPLAAPLLTAFHVRHTERGAAFLRGARPEQRRGATLADADRLLAAQVAFASRPASVAPAVRGDRAPAAIPSDSRHPPR